MSNHFILSQIIGVIILILCIVSYHLKDRNIFLCIICFINILWTVNMLLAGTASGQFVGCMATVRSAIYLIYEKREQRAPMYFLIISIALEIAVIIMTAESLLDYMLLLAVIQIWGVWQRDLQITRSTSIIASVVFATYNLFCGMYTSIIYEMLDLFSAATALAIYRRKKVCI